MTRPFSPWNTLSGAAAADAVAGKAAPDREAVRREVERLREEGDAMHTDAAFMSGRAATDVRRAGIARFQRADRLAATLTTGVPDER
jgi:predicted ArsR family transcriptional regulator